MSQLESELKKISQQIDRGVTPTKIEVRQILEWIGVSRRGNNVNLQVRRALEQVGLESQPEFEWAYVNMPLTFVKIGSKEDRKSSSTIYRIDGLESANKKPVSVNPESLISKAITLMLTNDFSQLPVIYFFDKF